MCYWLNLTDLPCTRDSRAASIFAFPGVLAASWRPTEVLTFDQLPLRRSRRTWRRIINVPLEIRPLSQAAPAQEFLNSYDGSGGWASADRRRA